MAVLPERQYIFTTGQIRSNYGGLTIAMMRRAKTFAQSGQPVIVTTTDMWPGYPELTREWLSSGVMVSGVSIRNIHDDYRVLDDVRVDGAPRGQQEPTVLKVPHDFRAWENPLDAGLKRFYYPPNSNQHKYTEYLREDGTVYMRTLSNPGKSEWDLPEKVVGVYDRHGEFSYYLRSHQQWWELWLRSITLESGLPSVMINDCEHSLFLGSAKSIDVPSIQFVHCAHTQSANDPMSKLIDRWVPLSFGQAIFDHVVFPTNHQRCDWQMQVADHVQTHVVPHAFKMPDNTFGREVRPRRCVIVSRLDRGKQLTAAIRIFHAATQGIEDAHLDIYGEGNDQEAMNALINELGMGGKITLHGYTPNAAPKYAEGRASIFTSEREGFGLSVLEALSYGCPVISFDTRYGPAEMVFDGESGFLIQGRDESAAAARLRETLLDDELFLKMHEGSRRVASSFSDAAALEAWRSVILSASPDESVPVRGKKAPRHKVAAPNPTRY